MTAVAKFVTDAQDLIKNVFLKTSFLIVLLLLFEIAQLFPIIQCNWCTSAFPFISYFKTPNPYTTYAVTIAMLLLLSRAASFVWEYFRVKDQKTSRTPFQTWKYNRKTAENTRKLNDAREKKNEDYTRGLHDANQLCQGILSQQSLISAMIKNDAYAYIKAIESSPISARIFNTPSTYNRILMHREIHFTKQDDKLYVKFGELTINTIQLSQKIPLTATEEGVVGIYNIIHAYKDHQEELTFAQL